MKHHENVWLRRMINHIQMTCGLNTIQTPTIIYEDNVTCVAQVQAGYVKSNLTKHINPKFFYAHELQKMNEVRILSHVTISLICSLNHSRHHLLKGVFVESV